MEDTPTHGLIRRACAAVLQAEPGLTARQITARLKRRGVITSTRDVEQELLAAPAVFRREAPTSPKWMVDPDWREALREEPTLLRHLALQNWKTFEAAELDFRDVTLLFGENSSGKSSIIQALLMLKQTYGSGDFLFEGEFGSFGDLSNVVHKHDGSAEMQLIAGWEMQLEPGLVFIGLTSEALNSVGAGEKAGRIKTIFYTQTPVDALPGTDFPDSTDGVKHHQTVGLSRTFFDDPDDELTGPAWSFDVGDASKPIGVELILHEDGRGWPRFDVVTTSTQLDHGTLTVTLRTSEDTSATASQLTDALSENATASFAKLAEALAKLVDEFRESLDHYGEILDSVIHIGPSRSIPSRWTEAATLPSDHYLRRLLRPELVSAVNLWLDRFDIPFEISIEVQGEHSEEAPVRLAVQHIDGGETVQLQDIGFGVSQLLPIIVQLVANQEKTILIEEPVAHVHPRLQSVLGDLFVESTQLRGNAIVAETHSEALLLRLQRRIAERALPPHRVAVFNLVRHGETAKVEPVSITDTGQLDYQWPGGFFDDRMDDLVAILDPTTGQ